jgi:hypothetical protein
MIIEPFDIAHIDIVATMLAKMWKKDIAKGIGHGLEFARAVVLNLFFDPQLALQACDDDGTLQAVAFARMKSGVNTSEQWVEDFLADKDEEERKKVVEAVAYLLRTERELLNLMGEDSAKFSFLISHKRGYAKALQERLIQMLIDRGVRWTYHITDSTCNWQYFDRHGFERIHEELVERFSTEGQPYYCFMYRKKID